MMTGRDEAANDTESLCTKESRTCCQGLKAQRVAEATAGDGLRLKAQQTTKVASSMQGGRHMPTGCSEADASDDEVMRRQDTVDQRTH